MTSDHRAEATSGDAEQGPRFEDGASAHAGHGAGSPRSELVAARPATPVRRVRLARLARQLSQDQLAEAAGITRQAVAGFEAGRFDPSLKVALRLAGVLGVSVEELFGGDGQPARVPARRVEAVTGAPRHRPGARVQLVEVTGERWAFPLSGDTAMSWGFGPATGQLLEAAAVASGAVASGAVASGAVASGVTARWPSARDPVTSRRISSPRGSAPVGEPVPTGKSAPTEGPPRAGGSSSAGDVSPPGGQRTGGQPPARPAASPADGPLVGEEVAVTVLGRARPTVVVAGCDPALPLLAGPLARHEPPVDLLWWPCSSGRALELLRSGAVHAAGAHLRDPAGGGYNARRTRSALGDIGAAVIGFASWAEGLALSPGSAASVLSLADVARLGMRLVNREAGAEARAVLERECRRQGVAPGDLAGWDTVLGGHLQIAAALASGLADAGITCEPAARAYGLEFRSLADERFDLVVPRALLGTLEVRALLGALGSDELHRQLSAIDGYDPAACGTVLDSF